MVSVLLWVGFQWLLICYGFRCRWFGFSSGLGFDGYDFALGFDFSGLGFGGFGFVVGFDFGGFGFPVGWVLGVSVLQWVVAWVLVFQWIGWWRVAVAVTVA